MNHLSRRDFLRQSALASLSAAALAGCQTTALTMARRPTGKLRSAIIGHTGQGNYGHGLDRVMAEHPELELIAVADADMAGLKKAAARFKNARPYASYREMLAKEQPDIVSVCPRWTVEHHDMAMAALGVGAHMYHEKPFATNLEEADEVLALADKIGAKIAMSHQMHLIENIVFLKQKLEEGLIGDLLEMRANGKQDKRAGGEDLMVLGVHLFDLMRLFAGDAQWCTARVLTNGRDITAKDGHKATEPIGPIAGDEIYAQFGFDKGVQGSFVSRKEFITDAGNWGMYLIGSKGAVRIQANIPPQIFLLKSGTWSDKGRNDAWSPIPGDPILKMPAKERTFHHGNIRMVDDLIDAIRKNRKPACSGYDGMKAVEMVLAVYQAAIAKARVPLPLADRKHPLEMNG